MAASNSYKSCKINTTYQTFDFADHHDGCCVNGVNLEVNNERLSLGIPFSRGHNALLLQPHQATQPQSRPQRKPEHFKNKSRCHCYTVLKQ